MKESRAELEKVSGLLDSALWKNAQALKSKPAEVEDATNLLNATRSAFKHQAVNHASALTLLHARNRTELLDTVSLIFRQGTEIEKCNREVLPLTGPRSR